MNPKLYELQNGSDIRGIALDGVEGENVNLTPDVARAIGAAFAQILSFKVGKNAFDLNIVVGRDPRLSGDELAREFMAGAAYLGAHVYDAGLASTPAMYMATVMPYFEFDGAVMVTASHLPWNRNGFKFFTQKGGFEKEDIREVLTYAAYSQIIPFDYQAEPVNLMEMYAAQLRSMISMGLGEAGIRKPDLKIAVDAGNGSGGFFAEKVLAPLGFDITPSCYLDPDGRFPNHVPNPEDKAAMASLSARVRETGADLGLIFDTDVDRSAAVTSSGKPLARNEIVALAAAIGADDHPGGTVVTDSITSNELHTFLEEDLGLHHLRYRRGYRNVINEAIRRRDKGEDAFLAIETSGHAAYSDNYFLDDGAFLAVQIVIQAAILKQQGKGIEALIDGLESPAEAEEFRLKLTGENFAEDGDLILESLKAWAEQEDALSLEEPNYEGVRVNFDLEGCCGWFLLRKSLHDPVMPLNVESEKEGGVEKCRALLREFFGSSEGIDATPLD